MNKKILIALAAVGAGVVLAGFNVSKTYAQEENSDKFPPMLQALVERFNLNKDEVDTFVTEQQTARQEEQQAEVEANLNQAVTDGKINEEQKTELESLMQKWQDEKPDFRGMGRDEARAEMESHRDEMQAWADANSVNLQDLDLNGDKGNRMGMGDHMGEGRQGGFGQGWNNDSDD